MSYTYNNPNLKGLRQKLRRNISKPEQILWYHLKGRQINNWKFRRQYGVGKYSLDFYCPEIRLNIEVDGDSHYTKEGKVSDFNRNVFLRLKHIQTLRFTNKEIIENIAGVLYAISSYHP